MLGTHATAKFRWDYTTNSGNVVSGGLVVSYDEYNKKDEWAAICAKSEIGTEEFVESRLKLTEIPNDKIR